MVLKKQKEASFKLKASPGFLACRGFVGCGAKSAHELKVVKSMRSRCQVWAVEGGSQLQSLGGIYMGLRTKAKQTHVLWNLGGNF